MTQACVIWAYNSLLKIILYGTIEGGETKKQKKSGIDNIKDWTGHNFSTYVQTVEDRMVYELYMLIFLP